MYGYEIARELERRSGGSLPMSPGALYPVLRSLEKQQLLSSYTELSSEDRARRYYELTETGRETMGHWRAAWQDTKRFIDTILESDHDAANRNRHSAVSKKARKGARKRTAQR